THNQIRNRFFRSIGPFEQAIYGHIKYHNANPKTFVRTKKAEEFLEKFERAFAELNKLPSD
ncbi:MAG: hypothetical protein ACKOGA_07130, partial [Planctomycetaceae bacterium]